MKIVIPTPPDFSFVEAVSAHGWRRLAPFVWDEHTQTLERAEALPTGVVLLQMSSTENGILVNWPPFLPTLSAKNLIRYS